MPSVCFDFTGKGVEFSVCVYTFSAPCQPIQQWRRMRRYAGLPLDAFQEAHPPRGSWTSRRLPTVCALSFLLLLVFLLFLSRSSSSDEMIDSHGWPISRWYFTDSRAHTHIEWEKKDFETDLLGGLKERRRRRNSWQREMTKEKE